MNNSLTQPIPLLMAPPMPYFPTPKRDSSSIDGYGKIIFDGSNELIVVGFGGDATVFGGDFNTTIAWYGKYGDLTAFLGGQKNKVYAGPGDDFISCGISSTSSNFVNGGAGDDVLLGGLGFNNLQGGQGSDTLFFGQGDFASGGKGNDHFVIVDKYGLQPAPDFAQLLEGKNKLTPPPIVVKEKTAQEVVITDLSFLEGDVLDLEMFHGATRESLHFEKDTGILSIKTQYQITDVYIGHEIEFFGGIDGAIWNGVLLIGGINGGSYCEGMF